MSERIEKRPGKCGGLATIKGTRLTVRTIYGCGSRAVAQHYYPYVPMDDIRAAFDYAAMHPEEVASEPEEPDPRDTELALLRRVAEAARALRDATLRAERLGRYPPCAATDCEENEGFGCTGHDALAEPEATLDSALAAAEKGA